MYICGKMDQIDFLYHSVLGLWVLGTNRIYIYIYKKNKKKKKLRNQSRVLNGKEA
jgi:hypothetical protein